MSDHQHREQIQRHQELVDRMVECMVNRAPEYEAVVLLDDYLTAIDESVRLEELAHLVLHSIERIAQSQTVYDIWDPTRRVDPAKATHLGRQAQAAFVDLHHELKRHSSS